MSFWRSSQGSTAALATLCAALAGCPDRVVVARVIGGYDINSQCDTNSEGCGSFDADAVHDLCISTQGEAKPERFSAHRLLVELRNDYPANEDAPDAGWEYVRKYTATYVSEGGGPDIAPQIVDDITIAIAPESTVVDGQLLLADLGVKADWAAQELDVPTRYSVHYLLEGDHGLEIELGVSFVLGNFNTCAALGSNF